MPYVPINWNELPASDFAATPVSAANLNHMDQGIKRTHAQALTSTQRDALTGADLFTGRIIFNTTVERFEIYTTTPPTSAANFSTPGWFRLPTAFDVVNKTGNETINGIKTFTETIDGTPKFIGARVHRNNVDLPVLGNTPTLIPWTHEDFDTGNLHSTTTNPTRLTVAARGYYQAHINIGWVGSFSSPFEIRLRRNGIFVLSINRARPVTSPSNTFSQSHSDLVLGNAGDYFEVQALSVLGDNEIDGSLTNFSFYRVGG